MSYRLGIRGQRPEDGFYETVAVNGTPLPQRSVLNIIGDGIEGNDNDPNTDVTFPAFPARFYPADSHTLLQYLCDDTSLPMVNSGTLGASHNLAQYSTRGVNFLRKNGHPTYGHSQAYSFSSSGSSANSQSAILRVSSGVTAAQSWTKFTLSAWVLPTNVSALSFLWSYGTAGGSGSVTPAIALNATTSYLEGQSTNGGSGQANVVIGGACSWQHIGITYDAAASNPRGLIYHNGSQVGFWDYAKGWGSADAWRLEFNGCTISDLRGEDTQRDATYFRDVFRRFHRWDFA